MVVNFCNQNQFYSLGLVETQSLKQLEHQMANFRIIDEQEDRDRIFKRIKEWKGVVKSIFSKMQKSDEPLEKKCQDMYLIAERVLQSFPLHNMIRDIDSANQKQLMPSIETAFIKLRKILTFKSLNSDCEASQNTQVISSADVVNLYHLNQRHECEQYLPIWSAIGLLPWEELKDFCRLVQQEGKGTPFYLKIFSESYSHLNDQERCLVFHWMQNLRDQVAKECDRLFYSVHDAANQVLCNQDTISIDYRYFNTLRNELDDAEIVVQQLNRLLQPLKMDHSHLKFLINPEHEFKKLKLIISENNLTNLVYHSCAMQTIEDYFKDVTEQDEAIEMLGEWNICYIEDYRNFGLYPGVPENVIEKWKKDPVPGYAYGKKALQELGIVSVLDWKKKKLYTKWLAQQYLAQEKNRQKIFWKIPVEVKEEAEEIVDEEEHLDPLQQNSSQEVKEEAEEIVDEEEHLDPLQQNSSQIVFLGRRFSLNWNDPLKHLKNFFLNVK